MMKLLQSLNKFFRLPEVIPCDKRIHIIVGATASVFMLIIHLNLFIIIGLAALLAIGIEVYQKITKSGVYDLYDALATFCGSLLVLLPQIIEKLVN